ncbi:hypothetical protein ACV07N_06635 [Roseivirga echinicomitans]
MKNLKRLIFSSGIALMMFGVFSTTVADAREMPGMLCYDSFDTPSWWVDDYIARICTPCSYFEGHDFGNESTCEPIPE